MQPATLPLAIYRGDTVRMRLTLTNSDGTPTDLTGALVESEIRDRPAGTLITPMTCTITLPNIIDLFLAAEASHDLPQKGVWDVQIEFPTGDVMTPLAGPVTITADVTDSTPGQLPS